MKKEERKLITITDDGIVSIPSETKMSIAEIADLFGIYYQAAKREIREIERSGVAKGDYMMSCSLEGQTIYPDYYGLEMVIALAFRVQSEKAEIFRRWICLQTTHLNIQSAYSLLMQNVGLN